MISSRVIKEGITKIFAITEKNLKLDLRVKLALFLTFLAPIIGLIMPIILMDKFFTLNDNYGPWTKNNFLVYQFIALNILLLQRIITAFPSNLLREKYWQTLPALIIAPFRRSSLLLGHLLSFLITISIPFTIFFIICYIYYPISLLTVLFVLGIYILIILVFSGIGLFIGIFTISKENISSLFTFVIGLFFVVSCVSYPYELFPSRIQDIISLNPLYYIFDILRLAWIEDNIIFSISSHPFHFLILVLCAITFPLIGVIIFNKVYKKFGIVGY